MRLRERSPRWPRRASLAVLGLLAFRAAAAAAQDVPDSVSAGQLENRYEASVLPPESEAPIIPLIAEPPTPAEAGQVRFVLSGVEIVGSTIYDPQDFVPLYEQYLAREITLAELYEIARAITAWYQRDGYVLSRAVVPEQQVELGVARIEVVEGSVSEVVIRGEVPGRSRLLEAYGRKITESKPLTRDALERYLLLMDDLPGVEARVSHEPLEERSGKYALSVFLEHEAVEGFASIDNRGSRFVGPLQGGFTASVNSLFGLQEQTSMRVIAAEDQELRLLEVAHLETVGTEGTVLALAGSRLEAEPGSTLEPFDVDVESSTLELSGAHPLVRSHRANLFLTGRLGYRNEETSQLGQLLADDRLRVVGLGVSASFRDALAGDNALALELSQGFDLLDASEAGSLEVSRPGGRSDFTKLVFEGSRVQPLGQAWELFVAARAQWSPDALLVPEQMGLGGELFGSAYDPSEVTGDSGAALRLEVRRNGSLGELGNSYQLYGFYDLGAVWNVEAGTVVDETGTRLLARRESLSSAGLGVRFGLHAGFSGYVELAQPLTRPALTAGHSPRLFFGITKTF